MLKLLTHVGTRYHPRVYVLADTDKTSETKIFSFEKSSEFRLERIPRSREVGQSYLTSVLTTLVSALYSLPLVWRVQPDLVLCNGPGTCVPICFSAWLLRLILRPKMQIVFVESVCRVQSLSLSAHLLKPFANHILVQWPHLAHKYKWTKFIARFV